MSSIRRSAEHEVEDAPTAAAAVVTQEASTPEASTSAPEIVGESGSLRRDFRAVPIPQSAPLCVALFHQLRLRPQPLIAVRMAEGGDEFLDA